MVHMNHLHHNLLTLALVLFLLAVPSSALALGAKNCSMTEPGHVARDHGDPGSVVPMRAADDIGSLEASTVITTLIRISSVRALPHTTTTTTLIMPEQQQQQSEILSTSAVVTVSTLTIRPLSKNPLGPTVATLLHPLTFPLGTPVSTPTPMPNLGSLEHSRSSTSPAGPNPSPSTTTTATLIPTPPPSSSLSLSSSSSSSPSPSSPSPSPSSTSLTLALALTSTACALFLLVLLVLLCRRRARAARRAAPRREVELELELASLPPREPAAAARAEAVRNRILSRAAPGSARRGSLDDIQRWDRGHVVSVRAAAHAHVHAVAVGFAPASTPVSTPASTPAPAPAPAPAHAHAPERLSTYKSPGGFGNGGPPVHPGLSSEEVAVDQLWEVAPPYPNESSPYAIGE